MKRFLVPLARMLAAVLAVNVVCFVGEVVAYGTWYNGQEPARLYIHEEGKRAVLRPGVSLPGLLHKVKINSDGFRGPELETPKPEDRVRLWCIGGSTTFDLFAADDAHTWPALLAQRLDAAWDASVDVVNGGVPGETALGGMSRLKHSDLAPDLVILYTGPNELAQIRMHEPMGHELMLPSIATVRVARRILPIVPVTPPEYEDHRLSETQMSDLRRDLVGVVELGIPVVLVTHAIYAQPGDSGDLARERVDVTSRLLRLTPEATIDAIDSYNRMVRELAEEHGLGLVDLRASFDGDSRWWVDSVHFSPEGSERAAQLLAEVENQLRTGVSDTSPYKYFPGGGPWP